MYVEAYLQSQQQIQLIPTENIAKFIEKMKVRSILTIFLTNIESLRKMILMAIEKPILIRRGYWVKQNNLNRRMVFCSW